MFTAIGEILFFIFALFASIVEIGSPQRDYHTYNLDERIEYLTSNYEVLDQMVEYAFDNTDETRGMDSISTNDIGLTGTINISTVKKPLKERISVYHSDKDRYVKFDFRSGTPGHSGCSLYYSENGLYMDPANGYEGEFDDETGKYTVYHNSSTAEVTRIDEHWFICEKSYPGEEGFKRKNQD